MKYQNTYIGGINKDTSKIKYSNKNVLDQKNFRVLTSSGLSTGSLETVKGNILSTSIPTTYKMLILKLNIPQLELNPNSYPKWFYFNATYPNYYITADFIYNEQKRESILKDIYDQISFYIPYNPGLVVSYSSVYQNIVIYSQTVDCSITNTPPWLLVEEIEGISDPYIIGNIDLRNETYIFTCSRTSNSQTPTNETGSVWKLSYNDTLEPPTATIELVYHNNLGFSTYYPIKGWGNMETNDIYKIYWVDTYNQIRHLICSDPLVINTPVKNIDITSEITLSKPKITSLQSNGKYRSGVVQYSYRLYNRYGSQTIFSPCSNLVSLTDKSEDVVSYNEYKGAPKSTETGKSVTVTINDLDDRYEYIQVVALFYDDFSDTPLVNIVKDSKVPSSKIFSFTDTSSSEGTYTYSEFLSLGSADIRPAEVVSKDNLLFVGNIKQYEFDIDFDQFDARAYRFRNFKATAGDNIPTASLYDNNDPSNYSGISIENDNGLGNNIDWSIIDTVDEKHNCINRYNDINNDQSTPFHYIYKSDGRTIGGEGPNVSYQFRLLQIPLDIQDSSNFGRLDPPLHTNYSFYWGTPHNGTYFSDNKIYLEGEDLNVTGFMNYANSKISGLLKGYTRGETYSFGIVFYDLKGKPSPVKWIGDIKMPETFNEDYEVTYNDNIDKHDFKIYFNNTQSATGTYVVMANILYPEFKVTISPTVAAQISGYSIVRCERRDADKSVITQGYCADIVEDATLGKYVSKINPLFGVNEALIDFTSPEILYYKNINIDNDTYLRMVSGSLVTTSIYLSGANGFYQNKYCHSILDITLGGSIVPVSGYSLYSIDKGYKIDPGKEIANFAAGKNYIAYDSQANIKNSTFAISMPSSFPAKWFPICNLVRSNLNAYGGNTYDNRLTRQYIECYTKFVNTAGTYTNSVFGGDTYINYMDNLRYSICSQEAFDAGSNKYQSVVYVPVESSINIDLDHSSLFHRVNIDRFHTAPYYYFIATYLQETVEIGDYAYPPGSDGDYLERFPNYTDLYLYNSVYSHENNAKYFYPVGDEFKTEQTFDTRQYVSDQKTNGNIVDAWTIFRIGNFKDNLDSSLGPITNMIRYKEQVVVFQEKGFGIQSVNPRSLLQDSNITTLVLGTGAPLDRFDYVSRVSGCKHRFGVVESKNGLYYFDAHSKKFYRFIGESQTPSDVKGMSSYFRDNIKGNIMAYDNITYADVIGNSYGIMCGYDERYNEVIFTFFDNIPNTNTVNKFTVAYNELIDAFSSFYSYLPYMYIKSSGKLLSTLNGSDIYLHDYGQYGTFYGIIYDSTVDLIVNPNQDLVNIFNNIELMSEAYDDMDNPVHDETIDTIRFRNDYQDTGVITLDATHIKRFMRTWRMYIPRDTMDVATTLARMRDAYIRMDIVKHNNNNSRFLLHDIRTSYTPYQF